MTIFCLEDFKVQFEKLKKKNSYSSIEGDIIEYFFNKEIQQLISFAAVGVPLQSLPPSGFQPTAYFFLALQQSAALTCTGYRC